MTSLGHTWCSVYWYLAIRSAYCMCTCVQTSLWRLEVAVLTQLMYMLIGETGFFTDSGRQPGQSRPYVSSFPALSLRAVLCAWLLTWCWAPVPAWQALTASHLEPGLLCQVWVWEILFLIHLFAGERGRLAYGKMKLSCAELSASLLKCVCRPSIWGFKEHGAGGKKWKT